MPCDDHLSYELVYDALYVHTDIEGAGFIHIWDGYSTATLTAGWRVVLQAVADHYAGS